MNLQKATDNFKTALTLILLVATPLFFTPFFAGTISFSKFVFILSIVALVLIISYMKFVVTKKIIWKDNIATQGFTLLVLSYLLSILLSSPNKLQAVFQPEFGLVAVVGYVLMYYLFTSVFNKLKSSPVLFVALSAAITSLIALVVMIEPFKMSSFPTALNFLTNKLFNPVGTSFHFIAFSVVALLSSLFYLIRVKNVRHGSKESFRITLITVGVILSFILIALVFHSFLVFKEITSKGFLVLLPPADLSWFAFVEILKNPITALFGVGVDNFSSIFTTVRNLEYNQSSLWQINSFSTSSSALLHSITETGLLGGFSILFLIYTFSKKLTHIKTETKVFYFSSLLVFIFLPPSIISYYLLFTAFAIISSELNAHKNFDAFEINLSNLLPIYVSIVVIGVVFVGSASYYLGRNILSEYYFKLSVDAVSKNDIQGLYNNQIKAIENASFNEEFRRQLAQTSLLIANNVAAKGEDKITDQDKRIITDAISSAINEAKTAVSLNSSKVINWQVLASVYKQIINVDENAPLWTRSAYQQAIVLDPFNPTIRLELGGVFYLFENYKDAQQMFEQAVSLKSDWANARYNLAWAYFKNNLYREAVDQMQITVGLLNPSKDSKDYANAQKNLDEFKKKLAEVEEQTKKTNGKNTETLKDAANQSQLNLPEKPNINLEEKIDLPESASPDSDPNSSQTENNSTPEAP